MVLRKNLSRLIFFFILFFLVSAGAKFIWDWKRFLDEPIIPPHAELDYVLRPGNTIKDLANDLHQLGYLKQRWRLIWLARWLRLTHGFKAGEYLFPAGEKPTEMLRQLAEGRVLMRHFTIVEGWNFQQILQALARNPYLTHH